MRWAGKEGLYSLFKFKYSGYNIKNVTSFLIFILKIFLQRYAGISVPWMTEITFHHQQESVFILLLQVKWTGNRNQVKKRPSSDPTESGSRLSLTCFWSDFLDLPFLPSTPGLGWSHRLKQRCFHKDANQALLPICCRAGQRRSTWFYNQDSV